MSWKVPEISHENSVRTLTNAEIALDKTFKDLEKDIIYVDNLSTPSLSALSLSLSLSSSLQPFYEMTTKRLMMPF